MRFVYRPEVTFCAGACSENSGCSGASECVPYAGSEYICRPACHPDCVNCVQHYEFEDLDYVLQYEYCADPLEPTPADTSGMGGASGGQIWECDSDCEGFACVEAQCLASCATSADCAPTHSCMPDGVCYPGGEEGDPCTTKADCATGACNPYMDVCERYCSETDDWWHCGSSRGMECSCSDGRYCDLEGPDNYFGYKECASKKENAPYGSSCVDDYECLSDNCCDGGCRHVDQICVGEPCTYGDTCDDAAGCSDPVSGPGVCMAYCDTVGEVCWNDTVCVSFGASAPKECMIRCEEDDECATAYGPEYRCEDDGVCRCFQAICPR